MAKPNKHSLQRALGAMTIGVARKQQARETELSTQRLDQRDQQFQVEVVGTVESDLSVWTEIVCDFAYVFTFDENVNDTPYDKPQFSFGYEMLTAEPVIIAACVTEWDTTPEGDVTAATVKVGAYTPNPDTEGDSFRARLHLTFSGYCGPIDGPDDDEEF
jgi:hypothetical protein